MEKYLQILKKYWGFDGFRSMQDQIVRSIGEGKDTLGLLPTGGGKSITFQVPAMAQEGICLVVTPLVALMKDQVANLRKKNVKAMAVYSGLSRREISIAYDNCIYGDYKFLYLSPERLSNDLFLDKLVHFKVSMIVVDEAHCISQWGYDFRPSYLKIAELRKVLPDVPVLALTATATPQIVEDIQERLLFSQKNVVRKSFERENLAYIVRQTDDKLNQLVKIVKSIDGCAVVFVRNRKKTKEYALWLQDSGITTHYYHAGLSNELKDRRQKEWMNDQVQVMVCTNAFGMGIDKPDVRLVVHMDAPDSIEAYFQEAGRAGRDGKKAYAVLLWSANDKTRLKKNVTVSFPEKEVIFRVYNALGNFFQLATGHGEEMVYDFDMVQFCRAYHFNLLTVFNSLKILQRAGYIEYSEEANLPSRVHFLVQKIELYHFQVKNEQFNSFIKLLLRSYTGFFTEYVVINEQVLAQRANVAVDLVYKYLNKLNHLKVIHYIPGKRTPLIQYIRPREELRLLRLPNEVYRDRKKQYEQRIKAVIDYAEFSHVCRSRFLLHYFGQKNTKDCGQCDVCIEKKKRGLDSKQADEIENKLKEILSSPRSYPEIENMIGVPEKKWLDVFNWLADNDIIYPDTEERWQLK
ncbi:RecQ family ATP-dependent DNA helicase [Saccharicrinis fermentans]|uniref:ATP-dependent DNA helicase RecQ n=1 Tax=Saccharicrinis fermentans DSM 9555 = JCM 21142 TaxID=869213 RepID=W7Y1E5_9BACT|nr:ATP-dependent DNA helicase RecQ [Saccharicrinis fermentans]GAF04730.1 ATP-dependent DNA helicase RecQ [Saccharicrinis fermentans DSM 9555 = JCM 21142]